MANLTRCPHCGSAVDVVSADSVRVSTCHYESAAGRMARAWREYRERRCAGMVTWAESTKLDALASEIEAVEAPHA